MNQMAFGFDLGPSILTMPYILKNYSNIARSKCQTTLQSSDCHINGVAFSRWNDYRFV